MTYLELVQRLRIETGYTNTGPNTLVGVSGAHERATAWIATAYTELQNRHDWRWLRKTFTLNTTSGTAAYAGSDATDSDGAVTRLKRWRLEDPWNPPKCYLSSAGVGTEGWLAFLPWEHFRSIYRVGAQNNGHPRHVTIDPDDNLVLGPTPDDIYVVSGEYHRTAQVLSVNADTPEMPSDYHMAIVYAAMGKYGMYDNAPETATRARVEGRSILRQLEATQLPKMRRAGPMA